jgi:hypothetical protein
MVHSPSKEDNYGVCLHLFIFILAEITGNRIGCLFALQLVVLKIACWLARIV